MPPRIILASAMWMHLASVATFGAPPVASDPDFSRDIRPILSDHCFACHGPDEHDRQADLRLDNAEGIATVIQPGQIEQSELIRRLHSRDADEVMPPAAFNKPLTDRQKKTLESWVASGAEVRGHWAFDPPVKSALPAGTTHPIDHFIDAKIITQGLTPNPVADDAALLRRVCLDLTGLPPTREQIRRLGDGKLDYEKLVEELLASPAFGQHFGRYWLDLVRYADTHGLHLDNYREMWPYRDWVIDAFNRNMPFDRFVIEQLGGDLLPNATAAQKIASGFNRLNVTTSEGGSIYDEVFARNVIDRTDAFGTVFLGMTTQCAVCHDHKFDPISQKEYYSLFAFFNSLDGRALDGNKKDHPPVISVPDQEQTRKLREINRQIEELRREMIEPIESVDLAQREWEASLIRKTLSEPDTAPGAEPGSDVPTPQDEEAPQNDVAPADAQKDPITLGALHLAGPFPVESSSPGFYRTFGSEKREFKPEETFKYEQVTMTWQARPDWRPVGVHRLPTAAEAVSVNLIHQSIDAPNKQTIDLLIGTSDGHAVTLNKKRVAESTQVGPIQPLNKTYTLELQKGHNDLYIKTVSQSRPAQFSYAYRSDAVPVPEGIIQWVRPKPEDRTPEQSASLRAYYREVCCDHPDWRALQDLVKGAEAARDELRSQIPTTLIWKELEQPREAKLLIRGQYDQPGETVARSVPSFLPPLAEDQPRDRLGLARWLVSGQHPLTGRVAVNRLWQSIFGSGLVRSSEDFGSQGDPPSHPELLDWLAVDFAENGWDVKRLVRQMVISQAYRRDASVHAPDHAVDPANRFLARGPRHRLDAEVLRDQALALAGLLNLQLGGPSVKPPQPAGLWYAVGYTRSDTANFKADPEPSKQFRRSVYIFWKRTSAPPQMSTFDAPSRESCTARRERTNTPLQALLLMNEPQFLQAAKHLAARALRECEFDDSTQRLAWLFETVTARQPFEGEIGELVALLEKLRSHYVGKESLSTELLSVDNVGLVGVDPGEHAAWMMIASTLLNLDEVVNK